MCLFCKKKKQTRVSIAKEIFKKSTGAYPSSQVALEAASLLQGPPKAIEVEKNILNYKEGQLVRKRIAQRIRGSDSYQINLVGERDEEAGIKRPTLNNNLRNNVKSVEGNNTPSKLNHLVSEPQSPMYDYELGRDLSIEKQSNYYVGNRIGREFHEDRKEENSNPPYFESLNELPELLPKKVDRIYPGV